MVIKPLCEYAVWKVASCNSFVSRWFTVFFHENVQPRHTLKTNQQKSTEICRFSVKMEPLIHFKESGLDWKLVGTENQ